MRSDHQALLAAVVADPSADLPRLVYADKLDESGDPVDARMAEFIRLQVRMAELFDPHEHCPAKDSFLARQHELLAQLPAEAFGRVPWLPGEAFFHPWATTPLHSHWAVRRGFVESVALPLADFFGDERPCPRADEAVMDPTTGVWECCRECDYTGVIGSEGCGEELFRYHPVTAVHLTDRVAATGVWYGYRGREHAPEDGEPNWLPWTLLLALGSATEQIEQVVCGVVRHDVVYPCAEVADRALSLACVRLTRRRLRLPELDLNGRVICPTD